MDKDLLVELNMNGLADTYAKDGETLIKKFRKPLFYTGNGYIKLLNGERINFDIREFDIKDIDHKLFSNNEMVIYAHLYIKALLMIEAGTENKFNSKINVSNIERIVTYIISKNNSVVKFQAVDPEDWKININYSDEKAV